MFKKINCKYNVDGAWCNNKNIKRSLFGLGARCCIEYSDNPTPCPHKIEYKKEGPPPSKKLNIKAIEDLGWKHYQSSDNGQVLTDFFTMERDVWQNKKQHFNLMVIWDVTKNKREGNAEILIDDLGIDRAYQSDDDPTEGETLADMEISEQWQLTKIMEWSGVNNTEI